MEFGLNMTGMNTFVDKHKIDKFLTGLLLIIIIKQSGANSNFSDKISSSLPAYAIASRADLIDNSSECHKELKIFQIAVDNHKVWSLRMLDSSGKSKSGFVYGNNYWIGSKTQCYDTMNKEPLALEPKLLKLHRLYRKLEEELPPYELSFFVAYVLHNATIQYRVNLPSEDLITLGLCLPATCSIQELNIILEKILEEKTLLISEIYDIEFELQSIKNLSGSKEIPVDWRMVTLGILVMSTLLLVCIATLYDVCIHQKHLSIPQFCNNISNNGKHLSVQNLQSPSQRESPTDERQSTFVEALMCFSASKNSSDIFTISKNENMISSLHGIRVLGMAWMIQVHVLLFGLEYMDNKIWAYRIAMGFVGQIISNGSVSVDTFFFMSGFLLVYTFFEGMKKNKEGAHENIRWRTFFRRIVRRYLRLTPPYLITIGLTEVVFSWFNETSIFYIHDRPFDTCPKYWWRNLLYINNLFKRSEMCLYWSYYLSNDMQFFVIGSFLLFLYEKYQKLAISLFFMLFFSTTLATGLITYINDWVPTVDNQLNTMELLYDPPWARIGPYLIGLAAGYIFVKLGKKLNVNRITLCILWALASACNLLVLFGLYDRNISIISTSIYEALHRSVWAIGIAWMVIACCTNNGGIVNKILSFSIWEPVSKLTYCAYLMNPLIIGALHLSGEQPLHVELISFVMSFLGIVVAAFISGYFLSLIFEVPYFQLAKLFFDRRTPKRKHP